MSCGLRQECTLANGYPIHQGSREDTNRGQKIRRRHQQGALQTAMTLGITWLPEKDVFLRSRQTHPTKAFRSLEGIS